MGEIRAADGVAVGVNLHDYCYSYCLLLLLPPDWPCACALIWLSSLQPASCPPTYHLTYTLTYHPLPEAHQCAPASLSNCLACTLRPPPLPSTPHICPSRPPTPPTPPTPIPRPSLPPPRQVMKASKGRVNPTLASQILLQKLKG